MSKVIIRAVAKKYSNGSYLLLPSTPAEKASLDTFCQSVGNKYVTITITHSNGNKSYDQVKTVFALCSLLFECNYDRKPNKEEVEKMYQSLLLDYADKEVDILNPNREIPIHLSRMNKTQAARFINSIFNVVIENCDLTDRQQTDVKSLFQEFKKSSSFGNGNPCDYDSNGNLLNLDKWCMINNVSMASGINDGTLECCHIISKNHRPDLRYCVWNLLRMTHYEHIEIQHRHGWERLLSIYPHLIPRVKAAYDRAGELYPFTVKEKFDKVEAEPVEKEVVKENLITESLADLALADKSCHPDNVSVLEG